MTKPKKLYRSHANYVGKDVVYHTHKYSVGQNQIVVYSSEKDKIAVTSELKSPFYVCEKCGYAIGKCDSAIGENQKVDKKETEKLHLGNSDFVSCYHKETDGRCQCSNHILKKRHLLHEFNTDIVQIFFADRYIRCDESTRISVLTALLDATSRVLHVERSDIAGCVRYNVGEVNTDTRFILFDNVAGGAGHVKRILNGDGEILRLIIADAYDHLEQCDCSPSCYKCLRSYENQEFHNQLDRFKAMDFLEDYVGLSFIPAKQGENKKCSIVFGHTNYSDFQSFTAALQYDERTFARIDEFDNGKYSIPDGYYVPLQGFPNSFVMFLWKKEKVMLVDQSWLDNNAKKVIDEVDDWVKVDIADLDWFTKLKTALIK